MTRWKLTLEYDGRGFVGWQRQANGFSAQQALEEAVEGFCGEKVASVAAGRTDSGVHALGMVADIALARTTDAEELRDALNFHLRPHPLAVLLAEEVPDDFSARFSALRRHYRYRVLNRRAPPTLEAGRAWFVPRPLDAAAMDAAAATLVGKHDFSAYRAAGCQAQSPVKTLERLEVRRDGEIIVVEASAPSFLYRQVRNLVGSLKLVGDGSWDAGRPAEVLAARDRTQAGPTAPAEGLYFLAADYPS